tara:strand:+ start:11713 stop:12792 length:1080 start_codon:yes stop_codon:yes gene_type:complete
MMTIKHLSINCIIFAGASLSTFQAMATGCDSCLQAKIESASSSISSSLTELNTSASSVVTATETVNQTITTASESYIAVLEANQSALLSSLDAATNKIEFSNEATTTTYTNLTDTLTNTINTNAKNQIKLEQVFRNAQTYGDDALPESGAIALNRAEALTNALVEFNGKLEEQMVMFHEWAYVVEKGEESKTLRLKKVEEKYDEYSALLPQLSTGLLTSDDVNNLLTFLMLVVLPEPIDSEKLSVKRQVLYNQFVERKAAAYKVLAKEVLMKAPLLSTDSWDIGYTQVESEDGMTSLEEFMHSESDRKLISTDWHDDISSLTDVGLLREQVHQSNMQNYLLNSLIDAQKDNLLLKSVEE